jgi:hypothetical protein
MPMKGREASSLESVLPTTPCLITEGEGDE